MSDFRLFCTGAMWASVINGLASLFDLHTAAAKTDPAGSQLCIMVFVGVVTVAVCGGKSK